MYKYRICLRLRWVYILDNNSVQTVAETNYINSPGVVDVVEGLSPSHIPTDKPTMKMEAAATETTI